MHRVEVPGAGQAVGALHGCQLSGSVPASRLRGEASPALAAAALEDRPAGLRRHARTEAVLALAAADVGLVGALHDCEKARLCQKNPRRRRGRAVSAAVSIATPLSTGFVHSRRRAQACGSREFPPHLSTPVEGFGRVGKLPANQAILSLWKPLLCWPPGRRRGGVRASVEHQVELSAEEPLGGNLRAAQGSTFTTGRMPSGSVTSASLDRRRRRARAHRSERVRPRLDRRPLPRADRRGGARHHRLRASARAPRRRRRQPRRRRFARGRRASFPWSNACPDGPRAAASARSTPSTRS